MNNLGQITGYAYGNGLNTTLGYDANDRLQSIKASTAGNDVFSRVYSFNTKGNPDYRRNVLTGQQENFTFDNLNRLVNYYDERLCSHIFEAALRRSRFFRPPVIGSVFFFP